MAAGFGRRSVVSILSTSSESTRKLLVGYEPIHDGDDALKLTRLLAEVLAARPLVVTALPWPTYLMGINDLQRQLDLEMREHFQIAEETLRDFDPETRAIASPSAAEALHELAVKESAKVLVLGSSHHGPFGRTLAGSVGESLMHDAPCAIAIAPRGYAERDYERLQRIGVAFDGSPEAWTALETAIGIAEVCHGKLTVLAVADYPHYGYAESWSILSAGQLHDAEREEKHRLVELAVGRVPAELEHESRLLTGDAGRTLCAASGEFDLMVSGSRAYGPLRRTVLGSTTRKLIRSSACPILVLPRGAGVDPLGLRRRRANTASRPRVHA